MNTSDSEIVKTILDGQKMTLDEEEDVILINTCAIRDHAEQKIWNLIDELNVVKKNKLKEGK